MGKNLDIWEIFKNQPVVATSVSLLCWCCPTRPVDLHCPDVIPRWVATTYHCTTMFYHALLYLVKPHVSVASYPHHCCPSQPAYCCFYLKLFSLSLLLASLSLLFLLQSPCVAFWWCWRFLHHHWFELWKIARRAYYVGSTTFLLASKILHPSL